MGRSFRTVSPIIRFYVFIYDVFTTTSMASGFSWSSHASYLRQISIQVYSVQWLCGARVTSLDPDFWLCLFWTGSLVRLMLSAGGNFISPCRSTSLSDGTGRRPLIRTGCLRKRKRKHPHRHQHTDTFCAHRIHILCILTEQLQPSFNLGFQNHNNNNNNHSL